AGGAALPGAGGRGGGAVGGIVVLGGGGAAGPLLVVVLLVTPRGPAARVGGLTAARGADPGALVLPAQIVGVRGQFGRAFDTNTQSVNQQLGHIVTTMNQRLRENAEVMQQTQRALGERLDSTAQVVGAVHRSLGTLEEANRKIYEIGKDIASLQ